MDQGVLQDELQSSTKVPVLIGFGLQKRKGGASMAWVSDHADSQIAHPVLHTEDIIGLLEVASQTGNLKKKHN